MIKGTSILSVPRDSIEFSHFSGSGGNFTPLQLSPYEWWRASVLSSITKDAGTGAVSAHRSIITGLEATQGTGAAQPIWNATSFNGFPGITYDGVDDFLGFFGTISTIPVGANAGEEWWVVDQLTAAAVTGSTYLGTIGGGSNNNVRASVRAVVSGTNRFRVVDSNITIPGPTTVFFSRCIVRATYTGALSTTEINTVAGTPTAVTSAIAATTIRFGASQTATSFGNFVFKERIFLPPLTAAQATALYAFFAEGIA